MKVHERVFHCDTIFVAKVKLSELFSTLLNNRPFNEDLAVHISQNFSNKYRISKVLFVKVVEKILKFLVVRLQKRKADFILKSWR